MKIIFFCPRPRFSQNSISGIRGFRADQINRKKIAYRELLPRVTASTQSSTPRGVLFFVIVELISGVWENKNKIKQMEKKLHIGVRVGRFGA